MTLRYVFITVLLFSMAATANARELVLGQVLQSVIDKYPSVRAATLQVEKAKQEIAKVESQLGWQLSAKAGLSHNVSVFNIASNSLNLAGAYSKQLESGSSVSIDETTETITQQRKPVEPLELDPVPEERPQQECCYQSTDGNKKDRVCEVAMVFDTQQRILG